MLSSQRAVLIIDGHYMYKAHTYDKKQRKIDAYKLIKHIENRLQNEGVSLGRRYFFDVTKSAKKLSFHKTLQNMHVQIVLNETKDQNVNCVNKNCEYHKKPFQKTVQAGVDVAIVTKALTLVADDQIDILVLVAGDGDFADALKWIAEVKHKKIWIIGHNASLSIKLKEIATPSMLSYLDQMDVWMDKTQGNNPNILPNYNPGNNNQRKPQVLVNPHANLPHNQHNPQQFHGSQNPPIQYPYQNSQYYPIKLDQIPPQHQSSIYNNQFNPSWNNQQNLPNQNIQYSPAYPQPAPQPTITKPSHLPPQQPNLYNQPSGLNSNNQFPYPIVNQPGANNSFKPSEQVKPTSPVCDKQQTPDLFGKNMSLLLEMGFTNYAKNMNALTKSNNSFDMALEYLMDKD